MTVKLYDYQITVANKLRNGSILWGDTGAGKSMISLHYYWKNERPRNLYIITTAKKRDSLEWEGEAVKYGIGKAHNATLAGILTVDSWNNIGKYTDVEEAFFIFDEQRLVGSGAWTKAFYKIAQANRWVLLTATPGDTWMDYVPVFIANGFYKNRTQFKHEHVVYEPFRKYPKIDHYTNVGRLLKLRHDLLVEVPYVKQNVRHEHAIMVEHDAELLKRAWINRWNVFKDAPAKQRSELFSVVRRIVNSDPSRLTNLRELVLTHKRIIVFYNFDYELDMIRSLQSELEAENFEYAEWNGHKHQDLPTSDRWLYVVQYSSGSEGWNCTTTNHMVFWSLTYSYRQGYQAQGRIDRLNSPHKDLHYYIFKSKSQIDLAIEKSRKLKKNFNESGFLPDF